MCKISVIINGITFTEGDYVGLPICSNQKNVEFFYKGVVKFGHFNAEIYDCYGLFVADEEGNQISEAGLDRSHIHTIREAND